MSPESRGLVLLVALSTQFLSSCTGDTRLEVSANALSKAGEQCLFDVRDRQLKYESSTNCTSLSAFAFQYIEAGGFRTETPTKYALVAEQARVTAWMALAISESGNKRLQIW